MDDPADELALETWLIHGTVDPTDTTGAVVPAIQPSTAFVRPALDKAGDFTYSRRQNPTRATLERALARLHGARRAVAFGSGMAAVTAVAQLLPSDSHVLLPDDVYGNTHRLYALILPKQRISVDFVDYTDLLDVEQKITVNTRMLWVETPTNPTQNIVDLAAVAGLGHRHGALVAIDNSWLSPYLTAAAALRSRPRRREHHQIPERPR
jgi:cystathionine beta-lyase/cystathionine gamma-synthase